MISRYCRFFFPCYGYLADPLQARLACTTAWIASPAETVQLLDELSYHAGLLTSQSKS